VRGSIVVGFSRAVVATVVLTAGAQGVKEELALKGAGATRSFHYRLTLDQGTTATVERGGAVRIARADGQVVASITAPFMYDTAQPGALHDVGVSLTGRGDGAVLTYTVAGAWADKALAAGHEIVVDPTVKPGPSPDCVLDAGAPTTSSCSGTTDYVGAASGRNHRAIVKFDLSGIRQNTEIQDAEFQTYLAGATGTTNDTVSAYQVARSWTSSATWNTYNGTNAWTSPGGDTTGSAQWTNAVGSSPGWYYYWYVKQLVQQWVAGTQPNNGLLLEDTNTSDTNELHFNSANASSNTPYLWVYYEPWDGVQKGQSIVAQQQLTSSSSLGVQVANGNLVGQSTDLRVAGTAGLNLSVNRTFNQMQPWDGAFEDYWTMSPGADVQLQVDADDHGIYLTGPSGYVRTFTRKADGTYTSPPGLGDSTLTEDPGSNRGGFTLTDNVTQAKMHFSGGGLGCTEPVDWIRGRDYNASRNNQLSFTYNGSGQLASMKDTQGRTYNVSYNANGGVSQITDPNYPGGARTWTYSYDSNTNLQSVTDPNGGVTQYAYTDGMLDLNEITTPAGQVLKITYVDPGPGHPTGDNRVASITRVTNTQTGTGPTWSFNYYGADSTCPQDPTYPNQGKTVVTDPNGHQTTYCWDSRDRVTKTTDANGNPNSGTYNSNNDGLTATSALSQTWTNSYDGNFRGMSSQQPAATGFTTGLTSAFGYDSTITSPSDPRFWVPKTATDTEGNVTNYTYFASGDVQTASDTTGSYSYTYNADGTVASETDGDSNTTTYSYTNGNLTGVTPPSPLHSESGTYDAVSRPATTTDGNGVAATYTYDKLDQITSVAYSNGPTLTYSYDADGNLLTENDATGQTSNTYDLAGRLTQETMPGSRTNTYGYDAAGNLTTLQDTGGTTTYTYDAGDRLASVQAPGETSPTTFSYYADDMPKDTAYPNGVTLHRDYDNPDRLSDIIATKGTAPNQTTLASYAYTYKNGNFDTNLVYTVTDKTGSVTTYGYGARDRLTSALNAAGHNYSYTYDPAGNMTQSTKDSTTTSYGYGPAEMPCWSVTGSQSSHACSPTPTGATTYSYDAAGNMTSSSGGFSASYNRLNQTTSMTGINGGSSLPFTYRGSGQTLRSTAGPSTYTEDALGVGVEQTSAGSSCYTHAPDGTQLSERVPSSGGTCNGARYYYLYDGQGSVMGLTDSSGNVQDTYSYDPYGTTTASGPVSNPWRYTGAYQDSTGGYKMGERYYSPQLMHWTQQDPAGGGDVYAADNPVNDTDPTGLRGSEPGCQPSINVHFIPRPGGITYRGTVACNVPANVALVVTLRDKHGRHVYQTARVKQITGHSVSAYDIFYAPWVHLGTKFVVNIAWIAIADSRVKWTGPRYEPGVYTTGTGCNGQGTNVIGCVSPRGVIYR
jgi:RHS repeat-associated protein